MKPQFESLFHVADAHHYHRFELRTGGFPLFWHYHPEYELTLILSGQGRRLAGDGSEPFGPGDWVLLGPDLPHCWVSGEPDGSEQRAQVLQFSADWVRRIFPRPEFQGIHELLARSAGGLVFAPPDAEDRALMAAACQAPGAEGLLALMQVLHRLSQRGARALTQGHPVPALRGLAQERLQQVLRYVQEAPESASLAAAASRVSLSKSAFCQFFKRAMGRPFSSYVSEVRVARAAALLIQTSLPIHQVAAQAGFGSLAYFNRVFLRTKGIQPLRFRQAGAIGR
ncbi:MAG: AraC family transcriptional regulator [Bacteroidia bacterium]|nr:AraC family transcriptional regulator [Bacteroidia bacterium]